MHKKLFVLASCFISCFALAQNTPAKFTIAGNIQGIQSGKAYLVTSNKAANQKVDSVNIINGLFTITDTVSQAKSATLIIADDTLGRQRSLVILEKGNIFIAGNMATPNILKITGTPSNNILTQYDAESNRGDTNWNDNFEKKYLAAKEAGNDSLINEYENEYENNAAENAIVAEKLIRKNPETYAALILLATSMSSLDITKTDELLKQIESKGTNYALKHQLREAINAKLKTAPGSMVPDIVQKDTSGKKDIALSSLRGKYVLIDFWASWCGPCRAENPNVVAAYNTFKDKNFTIYSVSLDDEKRKGKENWVQAIQKDSLIWPNHVSDLKGWANEAAQVYGVRSIPANLLIDPQGKVIATDLRGKKLHEKLAEILR